MHVWCGILMRVDDQWPPAGHHLSYTAEFKLAPPAPSYTLDVTIVGGRPNDLATYRLDRHGGQSEADREFQCQLHEAIGAIAVAGGHAEAAMKRVLIVAERTVAFSDAELPWGNLVKRLKRVADGKHPMASRLFEILEWAARAGVKKRRDDVVHAYWWNFAEVGVTRSRFTRDGASYILFGDLEQLTADARVIFKYAQQLDDLVVSDWPQARLPASPGGAAPEA